MLLGIDLGTSSLKVVVFDPTGSRCVSEAKLPLCVSNPTPERAEVDAADVWDLLVDALRMTESGHPGILKSIEGIGISTIFPALVPMDSNGEALAPVILYSDRRSVEQVNALNDLFGKTCFESITGNQLSPGTTTLPGILWFRDKAPDIFANTAVFGQLSTYLVKRLTGECIVDMSHTSLSGMIQSGDEACWSTEILNRVELDPSMLPNIVSSYDVGGHLQSSAGKQTGLPIGIPVVAGCGDAPLAALGGGITRPGQVFCSAGTTDCLMFSGNKPSGNAIFCNVRFPAPDMWVAIGTMSTAGASVKWFCESFMHCTPTEMTEWAEKSAPGAGGLTFLPYLQGERTPWWNPSARGVFSGLALTTGRNEACRAVLEGVACGWRQIISLLEEQHGLYPEEIIAVGGGTTNSLWNKIKATLLDRPVKALEFTEITSVGAALLGGLGAGTFASLDEAVATTLPLRNVTHHLPVPEWHAALEETYGRYIDLYPTVEPLFR